MRFLPWIVCVFLLWPGAGAVRASDEAAPSPTPRSFFSKMLHPFGGGGARVGDQSRPVRSAKGLELKVEISPLPLSLAEARQFKVSLSLSNRGKQFVQLGFPTTQRIEVLVRDRSGKLVTQWSEDQSFTNDPGYVAINPGEKVQYDAMLATRDLVAGKDYTIEAFFPNYSDLTVTQPLTPKP